MPNNRTAKLGNFATANIETTKTKWRTERGCTLFTRSPHEALLVQWLHQVDFGNGDIALVAREGCMIGVEACHTAILLMRRLSYQRATFGCH